MHMITSYLNIITEFNSNKSYKKEKQGWWGAVTRITMVFLCENKREKGDFMEALVQKTGRHRKDRH